MWVCECRWGVRAFATEKRSSVCRENSTANRRRWCALVAAAEEKMESSETVSLIDFSIVQAWRGLTPMERRRRRRASLVALTKRMSTQGGRQGGREGEEKTSRGTDWPPNYSLCCALLSPFRLADFWFVVGRRCVRARTGGLSRHSPPPPRMSHIGPGPTSQLIILTSRLESRVRWIHCVWGGSTLWCPSPRRDGFLGQL